MSAHSVRAPASTANLGPGFDALAAALDLWNELEVEERTNGAPWVQISGEGADELPLTDEHLALRAFALFTSPDRFRFTFVNRIPLERGLGSSAAAVAVGLLAGAAVTGEELTVDRGLTLGTELEGHADNLAAALHGGVCITWADGERRHAACLASDLPFAALLVVPTERTSTAEARLRLPLMMARTDAATTAGRAAMLGAAIASADPALFRDAVRGDKLHEPYRAHGAPLLTELKEHPPEGSSGVTLSGSGPSVVVWAEKRHAEAAAAELRSRLGDRAQVLRLEIASAGASARKNDG
jgi:homoserine kinase